MGVYVHSTRACSSFAAAEPAWFYGTALRREMNIDARAGVGSPLISMTALKPISMTAFKQKMEKASGPLWRLWRPLRCAAQRPCRPWRPRTPLRRLSSSSPSPGLSRCLRGACFAGGWRGIGGWGKSSQVKFITPMKQRVATALWVGENSKTLKIME